MSVTPKELAARVSTFETYATQSRKYGQNWRDEVDECRSFYAGAQVSSSDRSKLEGENRPIITLNRIRTLVDAVTGTEIVNRFEPHFFPRNAELASGDSEASDILNLVYKWIRQEADAENEESEAFRDVAQCGLGATETFIDYLTADLEPREKVDRVDILECGWDPGAKKQNLVDREWDFRSLWLSRSQFNSQFKDQDFGQMVANSTGGGYERSSVADPDHDPRRGGFSTSDYWNPRTDEVQVFHHQWFELESAMRVYSPALDETGEPVGAFWVDLEDADEAIDRERQYASLQGIDPAEVRAQKAQRKIFKEAWMAGEMLLEEKDAPVNGFSRQFITGFLDESNDEAKYWFGLVRAMIDPQRMVNRITSQLLHFLASNPKGLLLLPESLPAGEITKAWAKPDAVVRLPDDAFNGPGGKPRYEIVKPQPLPPGLDYMIGLMTQSLPSVAGINEPFFAGQAQDLSRTANSSIQSVQRANQTLLASLYDSLRRYRKAHARLSLDFIRGYFPAQLVARLASPTEIQSVQFVHSELAHDYDIVVDEQATSPNETMEAFSLMMQHGAFEMMLQMGLIPPGFFDYLPFPTKLRKEMSQMMLQAQQAAQAQPVEQQPVQ